MKYILISAMALIAMSSCNSNVENTTVAGKYGDSTINAEGAIPASDLVNMLTNTDTLELKVKGNISAVCQAKGCWMSMNIGKDKSMVVTFKDYSFFVPKNSAESEAVIAGSAFIATTSVAQLKEMAKDANKSQEEIDAITEDKVDYNFIADGVIIL